MPISPKERSLSHVRRNDEERMSVLGPWTLSGFNEFRSLSWACLFRATCSGMSTGFRATGLLASFRTKCRPPRERLKSRCVLAPFQQTNPWLYVWKVQSSKGSTWEVLKLKTLRSEGCLFLKTGRNFPHPNNPLAQELNTFAGTLTSLQALHKAERAPLYRLRYTISVYIYIYTYPYIIYFASFLQVTNMYYTHIYIYICNIYIYIHVRTHIYIYTLIYCT